MSTTPDFEDDEYVAKLLAEDARKSSIKYATVGMSALVPKRPTGAAPKPNTRFLKALVRDVDSHNAALKQKEELEAKSRLRDIRRAETSLESRRDREHRHRSSGHRHELGRGSDRKRRRLSDEDERQRRTRHERSERSRTSRRSRSPDHKSRPSRDRRHQDEGRRDDDDSAAEEGRASRGHRHESARIKSPERGSSKRDGSDEKPGRGYRNRSRSNSASSTTSDPLSSIIGPKPADPQISRKGRGFHRTPHSSNIDTRFSSSYNPSHDVDPDPNSSDDAADWDNALEALRDRRAWRVKQADRLREAGFGDEEIKRWETTSSRTRLADDEGDVKDVKWRKKGEQREWDAGKVSEVAGNSDETSDEFDNTPGRLGGAGKKPARASGGVRTSSKGAGAKTSGNEAWKRPDNALLKQFRNALG